jgi:hypothetical protein
VGKIEMTARDTAREFLAHTCLNETEQNGNGGDLRGMPADLSKFYPPTPTYEWLNRAGDKAA